jgi:hypothetical protein
MGPRRRTTVLAWSLWVLWAALVVLTFWFSWDRSVSGDSPVALATIGYASVGALVAARQPTNAIGWLLLAIAVTIALQFAGEAYVITESRPGYVAVAWVTGSLFNVWLALIVAFLPLVFPNGRLLSPRWRLVLWLDVVALVVGIMVVALTPGNLAVNASIENPLGVDGVAATVVHATERLITVPLLLGIVLAALSLALRFRRSTGVERQQLKWFAFAALMAIGGFLMAGAGAVIPAPWGDRIGGVGWTIFLTSCILGIPIATGIAILRYRLYDIDVVINRTLVYGSLTAALVATYVASILLLRLVLSPLTGQSDLAVAGSTLVVAAVFRPARSWIQKLVDRRFYRRRYDAAHTLEDFSARLRHELDLDAVGTDLCTTADQTLQPAHVSLWLRQPR